MLRVMPFANAFAAVSGICYFIGGLIAMAAPGLYLALLQSWFMLGFAAAGTVTMVTLGGFILGLITSVIAGWLMGAALAAIYNALTQTQGALR